MKTHEPKPKREDRDRAEMWWTCLRPGCCSFFTNPTRRDEHMATCSGCSEVSF